MHLERDRSGRPLPRVVLKRRAYGAVDRHGDVAPGRADGHLVPLARLEVRLLLLRGRLDDPGPAVRLVQPADVLGRVDLRLEPGDAAEAPFRDAEVQAAVARD